MTNTRKIIVALLVLVTMLMSMTAIVASAADEAAPADTYTIAGSEGLLGSNWSLEDTNNDMALVDGVYTKEYEDVKAGAYEFKVVKNRTWGAGNEFPSSNFRFAVAEDGSKVKITLNPDDGSVKCVVTAASGAKYNFVDGNYYLIAGAEGLTGAEWKLEAYSNVLIPTDDGKYSITYSNVAKGSYEMKVIQNPSSTWWDVQWGTVDAEGKTQNYTINVEKDFSVVVVNFDPNSDTPITHTIKSVGPIVNISDLADGKTTGDELIAGSGISASSGLTIEDNGKSIDGFKFTNRLKLGGSMKVDGEAVKAGIKIVTNGKSKIVVYAIAGSGGVTDRYLQIATLTEEGKLNTLAKTESYVDGDKIAKYEFTVDAAGTYYLGSTNSGINLYYIAVEEIPHVNTLTVGDTNKIVVTGNTLNDYKLPIEWVAFTADENAHYSFIGDEGVLAFIFKADGTLVSATGAANLEVGTYLVCLGNGVVGEFNVAVTKAAWDNTLAIGDNKVLITAIDNGAGYYIAWAPFEVTEKANYSFTGEGILALVYDSAYQAVAGTELDVGTYYVCVAFLTPATTGIAPVKVEKTPLSDTPVVEEPTLALGDNTVTIDGSETNITGNAIAWYTFTPTEAGTYKFSCSDLTVYILKSKNMADLNEYVGADGVAELEADTKYYVLVGKDGVKGEFTVKVESGAAPVHKNTVVVGDNKYIISDALLKTGYEFLLIEVTEAGVYKFTGGAPMTLFVFHDAYLGEALDATAPYTDNIDDLTYEYVDHFYVNLAAPGFYWVGFRYDYVGELREFDIKVALHTEHTYTEGKCECGAADPNYQPPHEHNFVEGKCECGETDPNYVAPAPQPEPSFFESIWQMILGFFAKIAEFFKGLFA